MTQFVCDKIQRMMNDGNFVRDFLLHMSIAYRMLRFVQNFLAYILIHSSQIVLQITFQVCSCHFRW